MGWSGLRWQTKDRSKRLTKGGIGCSARTDWDGIEKDGFAYSATSTAAAASELEPSGSPANGRGVCTGENSAG